MGGGYLFLRGCARFALRAEKLAPMESSLYPCWRWLAWLLTWLHTLDGGLRSLAAYYGLPAFGGRNRRN